MSLDTILKPLKELNDVLISGKMSFSDPYFTSIFHPPDRSPYELEQFRARFAFACMKGFVLLMVIFFFLFLYYCLFGFVMGYIQESGGRDNPAARPSNVKQEKTDASTASSASSTENQPPQTPTKKNPGKAGKNGNSAKKAGRKA